MDNLLAIRGLCKNYDGFALHDVDLTVPAGSVVGFIGTNGAGKTTTIKSALGATVPDDGSIELFGQDVRAIPENRLAELKQHVGAVFDACSFPSGMRVRDVGGMMGRLYKAWDASGFDRRCTEFGLSADKKVKELSRGMGMKLMLACALSHDAALLVLDEATAGLDPMARDEVLDTLRSFIAGGYADSDGSEVPCERGILISSHITSDLEKIADYIVCIDKGRIVFASEKDAITETAGIARCRADQFAQVRESDDFAKVYFLAHSYGTDMLVDDRFSFQNRFPGITVDRATIDEYMSLRLKGGVR